MKKINTLSKNRMLLTLAAKMDKTQYFYLYSITIPLLIKEKYPPPQKKPVILEDSVFEYR